MLREFLSKYSQRDQAIMIALAVLVVVSVLYLMVFEPLVKARTQNQDDYIANQELLAYMKKSAAEYRVAGGVSKVVSRGQSSSAVVVVESTLQQNGLSSPKRIEPNGNDKAVVQYDVVNFDKLVQALDKLEHNYGIVVEQAKITRQKESEGKVQVLLNLVRQ